MTTGPGRRSTPVAAAVAVLVLSASLALSGCSGDEPKKSSESPSPSASLSTSAATSPSTSPSTSASASTSASPSPAAQRAPSVPAARRGSVGQKTFARYVMALWGYGLRSNDARALVRLSPPGKPCKGCRPFATSLKHRKKQGWYVDFQGLKVRRLALKKVADNTYAKATVDIPASDSLNADGSFRNPNKAHDDATFEVLMHRGKKHYQLLAFTVS